MPASAGMTEKRRVGVFSTLRIDAQIPQPLRHAISPLLFSISPLPFLLRVFSLLFSPFSSLLRPFSLRHSLLPFLERRFRRPQNQRSVGFKIPQLPVYHAQI